jgi:hypothetical protein
MLRHHHIPNQLERVSVAYLIQDFHESVARSRCSQQRLPAVTTEGHKMKITLSIVPLQRIAHITATSKTRKTRTLKKPQGAAPLLNPSEITEVVCSHAVTSVKKKDLSMRHPSNRLTTLRSQHNLPKWT